MSVVEKTGGAWYSTFAASEGSAWRVVEVEKVVTKACSDASLYGGSELPTDRPTQRAFRHAELTFNLALPLSKTRRAPLTLWKRRLWLSDTFRSRRGRQISW